MEDSHPAIIDKKIWEVVQLEIERRRKFAKDHNIKLNIANPDNPFAGKVICGCCGKAYGRKVWNSTDERLRRYIWQCSGKYEIKGEKGVQIGILTKRNWRRLLLWGGMRLEYSQ